MAARAVQLPPQAISLAVAMSVYYNDNEPFVCDWLENLIKAKLLPDGVVDRRPIEEVRSEDVQGFTQCHFFAGIGGWPYALQLAGWGDRPVWTGSCPCQPFSAAGRHKSHADDRHLWPAWHHLIAECRPDTVFGEQVGNAVGLGWFDAVRADLEAEGYAVGATVLGAHSVGAPHIRQRFWFVADAKSQRCGEARRDQRQRPSEWASGRGEALAYADSARRADTEGGARSTESKGGTFPGARNGDALQHTTKQRGGTRRRKQFTETRQAGRGMDQWLIEPPVGRVADGIPDRVGKLRGLGNAIVPQVAAAFVSAYMEVSASQEIQK